MKKSNNRKPFILGMIATTTVTSLVSWAAVTDIPGFNVFNSGSVISSTQMNQNFEHIYQNAQNLCNKSLNGKALDCTVTANDKDVLSFDAVTQTWKPRTVNGLNYLGSFDASSGTAPTAQPSGSYYIISVAGTISGINFEVGDWIVSNGAAYQKIDNSTTITSIFGRTGAVVASEGDYNLDKLSDVDLTTAPTAGQVLKFNGTNWTASTDNTSGAGSVTTTEILDGAITNADISPAAAISYSKLNIGAGEIPQDRIAGLNTSLSALVEDVITDTIINKAPSQNAVYDSLALKSDRTNVTQTITAMSISGLSNPIALSDAANKQYVDNIITSSPNQWTSASGNVYRPSGNVGIGTSSPVTKLDVAGSIRIGPDASGCSAGNAGAMRFPSSQIEYCNGVSWVAVSNSGNILTEAPQAPLAGFTNGPVATVTSADTILVGMGKLQGQISDVLTGNAGNQWIQSSGNIYRNSGSVAIGTSTPNDKLVVANGGVRANSFAFNNNSGPAYFSSEFGMPIVFSATNNPSSNQQLTLTNLGKVGIGISSPAYDLHVMGTVAGTSAFVTASDKRLKENIHTVENALDKIHQLRGVRYHFTKESQEKLKNSSREELGVIAQEVKKVFPQAVSRDTNGMLSVAYSMLISPLIEAVKELDKKVSVENKALKEENAAIKNYLCEKDPHAPFCSN